MDHRPTSPHLTIYRPQITSITSILHRMTGVALYAGTALLMVWLWSAAYAPDYYAQLHTCMTSLVGKLLLMGWTFAFFYHLANGIRHLFWDIGKGYALCTVTLTGWLAILFALGMTGMIWGYMLGGAL